MCSTYKVAIAIYILSLAENNFLNINELCEIRITDLIPGVTCTLNQLNYDIRTTVIYT